MLVRTAGPQRRVGFSQEHCTNNPPQMLSGAKRSSVVTAEFLEASLASYDNQICYQTLLMSKGAEVLLDENS